MKHIEKTLLAFLLIVMSIMLPSAVWADGGHRLTVVAKPVMAGSFNTSAAELLEGETIHLYAYANASFTFLQWTDDKGDVVSQQMDFTYVMPARDVTLTAEYEYNPANPANPARNYWNKGQGEVIVDDFTTGSLQNAVKTVIGDGKANDVMMITVAGVMNTNDFGIINTYSASMLLDLSRVTGITEVPSYAFDYTNLETVYLPSSIEKIGARAFADCTKLSSITIYAMTPPTLESGVFQGVPEGLVIYVPAAAIAQYQDVEAWGKYTLLPIQEDIRSISISLPDGSSPQDYSQMWLELTNTKSGQRMHYVMTDRMQYTFANIIRNTSWNIVLRNERGDVFGQIDNVEVKDEDVTVTFAALTRPQNVSLTVLTTDGQDVTSQTQITWTDVQGNYVAQGSSLSGLPVGYQVNCRIVLSKELSMVYDMPSALKYTLKDGDNALTCQLQSIKQLTISGKVKDASTGLALNNAIVSVSQTFGGKYSKTLNVKTDNNGAFSVEVFNVPTFVAIAATDYVSQTLDYSNNEFSGLTEFTVPDVSLKSITGATISVGFTYTTVEGETQNWYSDYQNVNYTLYNSTHEKPISQFNVQYPQIVLLEEVEDGDVLRLTATSRTNAFKAVDATATITEQKAEATFAITELGRIEASFFKTGNASVVGSLYDATGKLVKTYNYSEAKLTINDLADGSYTLVSMGNSRLFNTIYDIVQLPQTGLVEGSDYVKNAVEVKSGAISQINIEEVPTLDESKLYYTGDNTSFTVNKPSIVAGNYLTLTGRIDFKPAYATNVGNVQMIVDLPESCEFVENSVMVGNSSSTYTRNGQQLIIPMARYTDRVRFCVIPTLGGEYAPSAFVQFDLDGETVTQPIGSANYTAKDLSISVPSTVAKTSVPVSGTAIGTSNIEIYDNGVLIGQTTSLANGTWATTCELDESYNLSTHNIYAKVMTKTGLELISETKQVLYDKNMIVPEKVTMLYYNPEFVGQYNIVFDLINGSVSPKSYYFFPYKSWPNWRGSGTEPKEFTFVADLTNNDTTVVSGVTIRVYTDKGNWRNLEAKYDTSIGKWMAVSCFESKELPVGVKVEFSTRNVIVLDAKQISDSKKKNEEIIETFSNDKAAIEETINKIKEILFDSTDFDQVNNLFDSFNLQLSEGQESDYLSSLDSLGLCYYVDSLCSNLASDIHNIEINIDSLFSTYGNSYEYAVEIGGFHAVIRFSNPEIVEKEELLQTGYIQIPTTTGNIYEKWTNNTYTRISVEENVCMTIIFSQSLRPSSLRKAKAWDNVKSMCWERRGTLTSLISDFELIQKQLRIFCSWFTLECSKNFAKLMQKDQSIANALKAIEIEIAKNPGFKHLSLLKRKNALLAERAIISGKLAEIVASQKATLKFAGVAIGNLTSFIFLLINEVKTFDIIYSLDVPYCLYAKDYSAAIELENDIIDLWQFAYEWYCWSAARLGIYLLADVSIALIPEPTTLTKWLSGILIIAEGEYEIAYHNRKSNEFNNKYSYLKSKINKYKKRCKDDDDNNDGNDNKPPHFYASPIQDPSGYVYEGVFSNRLEGVSATVFYKEMVEDIYGDLHENIVKWDAEEYAQENPLFTDENGFYRWDVPQGLWQVKFEKDGYETTYSEWLPVPPPQLDVNIAIKQNVPPTVKMARAFEDAVEVEFDKYMMPELLTIENILVMQGNEVVAGNVELLNNEPSYEESSETFASKIRFNAVQPFTEQEITLMVSNRVKSYAGIRMQDDYQQNFTVEQEIKQIISDSLAVVGYGEKTTLTISVLPASASKGKTLSVKTSSPMILGVETEQVKIGNDGKADITMSGELPGTAALTFTVDGTDKTALTIASVEQKVYTVVATPVANIASGSVVDTGTQITLSCKTNGVTIYYTIDGTCPCDNDSRIKYDGTPIVINEGVTIKVIAIAADGTESDVAEFVYITKDEEDALQEMTLNGNIQVYPLLVRDRLHITANGKNIQNVIVSAMNGIVVASSTKPTTRITLDVSAIPTGMYIVNVVSDDGVYCHKIMKTK